MNIAFPLSLTDRFSQVIDALHALVAAQFRGPALSVAMIGLICGHLRRVERRVLALVARVRAGDLRVWHGRGGRPGPRETAASVGPRLPRGYAWLCKAVPNKAAALGGWLRVLLEDPEMVALIAATPRMGQLLRPLCRMLAVDAALAMPSPADAVTVTVDDGVGARRSAQRVISEVSVTPNVDVPVGVGPLPHWGLRFFKPA